MIRLRAQGMTHEEISGVFGFTKSTAFIRIKRHRLKGG